MFNSCDTAEDDGIVVVWSQKVQSCSNACAARFVSGTTAGERNMRTSRGSADSSVFHRKRHPRELGEPEVTAFVSSLAARGVSASTRTYSIKVGAGCGAPSISLGLAEVAVTRYAVKCVTDIGVMQIWIFNDGMTHVSLQVLNPEGLSEIAWVRPPRYTAAAAERTGYRVLAATC